MSIIAFDLVAIPTVRPEEMLRFYRALGFSSPTSEKWRAERIPFFSIPTFLLDTQKNKWH